MLSLFSCHFGRLASSLRHRRPLALRIVLSGSVAGARQRTAHFPESRKRSISSGTVDRVPRRLPARQNSAGIPYSPGIFVPALPRPYLNVPAARNAKIAASEAHDALTRNQHRTSQNVGIHLVQQGVFLRNPSGVDHALDRHSVFGHAIENHPSVQRRTFDGGEQLILGGALQVPSQRHATQVRIHQHGAIAVVPGQPQQAGLSCADSSPSRALSVATSVPARLAIASKMSPTADKSRFDSRALRMHTSLHHTAHAGNQVRGLT